MAQYRTGAAVATNGSPIVTGSATTWQSVGGIQAGDLFAFTGEGVYYEVASVQSDTQLTLASNYVGATRANAVGYQIQVDFTPNNKYATPTYGDADTAGLIKQTLLQIDAQLAALSPVPGVVQGAIQMSGALQVAGASLQIQYNSPTFGSSIVIEPPGGTINETSLITFYATFGAGTDTGARRTADILAGFANNGGWNNEYLSICVGNAGVPNDAAALTIETMRIFSGRINLEVPCVGAGNLCRIGNQLIMVGDLFVDANGFVKRATQVGGQ